MELLKLAGVFSIIILVLWLKRPLAWAVTAATAGTILLYRLPLTAALEAMWRGATSWGTVEVLLVFYLITYLQRMLENRHNLTDAQLALSGIYNNRRVNASAAPVLLGMLPAVGTVLLCGDMVRSSVGEALSREEKAFVTSYYRHVSELFLPTYTTILIALGLSGGRVSVSAFVLAMLPMVGVLMFLGWLFYLRRVPRDTGVVPDQPKGRYWLLLCKSLWTIALTIVLIIALGFPVEGAVFVAILLNIFVGKFKPSELGPMVRAAFEGRLILSTWLVMIFKEVLAATGVISSLPAFFSTLPIPTFLIFALIFFFGTIVSGFQAIVVLCMGMAMATVPQGGGVSLFILLMCMGYAANQLSPIHVCLAVCAEDYGIPLGALVRKAAPVVGSFCAAALGYYGLLRALGL